MKIIWFLSVLMTMLCGCHAILKKDDIKELIPGVYVRHYTDEYTDSHDTIEIRLMTAGERDSYTITKRTRFQKQTDDGKVVQEYQIKRWNGFYEDKTQTIWLPTTGKRIYFDPVRNELKIGIQPYQKLR